MSTSCSSAGESSPGSFDDGLRHCVPTATVVEPTRRPSRVVKRRRRYGGPRSPRPRGAREPGKSDESTVCLQVVFTPSDGLVALGLALVDVRVEHHAGHAVVEPGSSRDRADGAVRRADHPDDVRRPSGRRLRDEGGARAGALARCRSPVRVGGRWRSRHTVGCDRGGTSHPTSSGWRRSPRSWRRLAPWCVRSWKLKSLRRAARAARVQAWEIVWRE